jgi:hypothetical protein
VIGVVALVGDRDVGDEALDELVGESDVVALTWRAEQAHRVAERIASGVDFRAQAPRERPRPWACGSLTFSIPQPLAEVKTTLLKGLAD